MKSPAQLFGGIAMGLVLAGMWLAGCGQPPAPAPHPVTQAAVTNKVAAATPVDLSAYQSIFEDFKKVNGLDPFFPNSTNINPPSVSYTNKPPQAVDAEIVLHGLSIGRNGKLALINNATMAEGEDANIHLPNGSSTKVHLIEIREDSVMIRVQNEPRPREIRMHGKK